MIDMGENIHCFYEYMRRFFLLLSDLLKDINYIISINICISLIQI